MFYYGHRSHPWKCCWYITSMQSSQNLEVFVSIITKTVFKIHKDMVKFLTYLDREYDFFALFRFQEQNMETFNLFSTCNMLFLAFPKVVASLVGFIMFNGSGNKVWQGIIQGNDRAMNRNMTFSLFFDFESQIWIKFSRLVLE